MESITDPSTIAKANADEQLRQLCYKLMHPRSPEPCPADFSAQREWINGYPDKKMWSHRLTSAFNKPTMVAIYAALMTNSLEEAILFVTDPLDDDDNNGSAAAASGHGKMRHPFISYI